MSNRNSLAKRLILVISAAYPTGLAFAQVADPVAPFYFEANRGQTDHRVRFLARSNGYTFFVTPTEALVAGGNQSVRMRLVDSRPPIVRGLDPLPGRVHYFRGSDPRRWHRNLPTYARVQVDQVYPGIDLIY